MKITLFCFVCSALALGSIASPQAPRKDIYQEPEFLQKYKQIVKNKENGGSGSESENQKVPNFQEIANEIINSQNTGNGNQKVPNFKDIANGILNRPQGSGNGNNENPQLPNFGEKANEYAEGVSEFFYIVFIYFKPFCFKAVAQFAEQFKNALENTLEHQKDNVKNTAESIKDLIGQGLKTAGDATKIGLGFATIIPQFNSKLFSKKEKQN